MKGISIDWLCNLFLSFLLGRSALFAAGDRDMNQSKGSGFSDHKALHWTKTVPPACTRHVPSRHGITNFGAA